jgi:hypothetical protein
MISFISLENIDFKIFGNRLLGAVGIKTGQEVEL